MTDHAWGFAPGESDFHDMRLLTARLGTALLAGLHTPLIAVPRAGAHAAAEIRDFCPSRGHGKVIQPVHHVLSGCDTLLCSSERPGCCEVLSQEGFKRGGPRDPLREDRRRRVHRVSDHRERTDGPRPRLLPLAHRAHLDVAGRGVVLRRPHVLAPDPLRSKGDRDVRPSDREGSAASCRRADGRHPCGDGRDGVRARSVAQHRPVLDGVGVRRDLPERTVGLVGYGAARTAWARTIRGATPESWAEEVAQAGVAWDRSTTPEPALSSSGPRPSTTRTRSVIWRPSGVTRARPAMRSRGGRSTGRRTFVRSSRRSASRRPSSTERAIRYFPASTRPTSPTTSPARS